MEKYNRTQGSHKVQQHTDSQNQVRPEKVVRMPSVRETCFSYRQQKKNKKDKERWDHKNGNSVLCWHPMQGVQKWHSGGSVLATPLWAWQGDLISETGRGGD